MKRFTIYLIFAVLIGIGGFLLGSSRAAYQILISEIGKETMWLSIEQEDFEDRKEAQKFFKKALAHDIAALRNSPQWVRFFSPIKSGVYGIPESFLERWILLLFEMDQEGYLEEVDLTLDEATELLRFHFIEVNKNRYEPVDGGNG